MAIKPTLFESVSEQICKQLAITVGKCQKGPADIAGLDDVIRQATETQPAGAAFTGKILSRIQGRAATDRPILTKGWRWAFSVSAVAAVALGFFTGMSVNGPDILGIDSASALTIIADQAGEFDILL